jgi:nucleoid-associated protein YgaU
MKLADGRTFLSTQNVAVDIPENKNGPLLVAKTEAGQPTQLLTPVAPDESSGKTTAKAADVAAESAVAPTQPKKSPEPTGARAIVAITVVEAEDSGTLYAAGKAAAGATVRLYLNDSYLASADVGQDASWALKIAKGVVPGQYRVRADDVDPATGKVYSRAEVGFDFASKVAAAALQPAPAKAVEAKTAKPAATPEPVTAASMPAQKPVTTVFVDSIETATVTRGDSLWRISRKTYGAGVRYTDIHKANQQQIRDPDLIYPGQVFVIPKLKS